MSQTKAISGPYLRTEQSTRNIMLHVSISLIPALLGAVYYFGIKAFYLAAFSVALCVLTEFLWQKVTKKQVTVGDFSAVVTGMLLAFNMPVTVPLWVLAAADIFSILIVKQMFGGIGSNFANPALMGRLLVMVVWPGTVLQYTAPRTLAADAVSGVSISVGGFADLAQQCIDQAAGVETEEEAPKEGTQVDGISGATISSTAAVNGINAAYEFLQTID